MMTLPMNSPKFRDSRLTLKGSGYEIKPAEADSFQPASEICFGAGLGFLARGFEPLPM